MKALIAHLQEAWSFSSPFAVCRIIITVSCKEELTFADSTAKFSKLVLEYQPEEFPGIQEVDDSTVFGPASPTIDRPPKPWEAKAKAGPIGPKANAKAVPKAKTGRLGQGQKGRLGQEQKKRRRTPLLRGVEILIPFTTTG